MSDVLLTSIVWKRRSGFAQFSDALTGSNSWEKRIITLHHTPNKPIRLCYYAIESPELPRGTIYINSERAIVWTNHHPSDGTQPTPYSLSILPDGGSKWKFCFDDRNTQYAWLLALNDVIVEECVREYNSRILIKEAGDHSGGFHRLYEEGVPGLFESTKGMLLGDKVETAAVVLDKSERMSRRLQDSESIEVVGIKTDKQPSVLIEHEIGRNPVKEVMSEVNILSTSSEVEKLGLTTEKLHQAFFVVNLSVVYVYLTAQSDSFIAIPWWQVLMVMNAITYYLCLSPNNEEKKVTVTQGTTKEDLDPKDSMASVSKSVIGTALLQSEEVPLSEIPMELAQKPTVVTSNSQHRTEQLSEDEMTAHLHERWAMSAPNCDLSGSWTLIADESFKAEYDSYLKQLGFNRITRGVACSLIARTTEVTKQSKGGRELYLKGINPKGAWERVLVASGFPDFETHDEAKEGTDYTHMRTSIKTADAEDVDAEAWWEERGTVHRSWLRGGTKYGGGDFESLRYIEEGSGGNILVCESIFHPKDEKQKKACVKWRFQRDQ